MIGWFLRRSADALITALLAVVALVALVHFLPGDPLAAILGDRPATPEVVAALRERWCTDRSLAEALNCFFSGVVHGDLGVSLSQQRPVMELLGERIGPTLLLGGLTLLIDFTIGLALGLWAALHPDSRRARLMSALTIVGYAMPTFVIGQLLVYLFGVTLGWLPTSQMSDPLLAQDASWSTVLIDHLRHLVLPLATMVIATIAVPLRQQRSAALDSTGRPWVLAARARGVSPARVAWRHCWRPALTPIVTLLGLWLPMLIAGAVFVEHVFAWPGLGSLIADATATRDLPLVIGAGILFIFVVQLGSLVADVLYRVVDPAQRSS